MKRSKSIVLACMVAVGVIVTTAKADLQPSPANLDNLPHGRYYTWEIDSADFSVPSGETITGASLFFDDIRNWANSDNKLFVSLLDGSDLVNGTHKYADTISGHYDNNQEWNGYLSLVTYTLPNTPADITYVFDDTEIDWLNNYISDGNFGIGFDPDCHFFNEGITLTIETAPVPIPGAVLLGMLGLSVAGLKLRKHA